MDTKKMLATTALLVLMLGASAYADTFTQTAATGGKNWDAYFASLNPGFVNTAPTIGSGYMTAYTMQGISATGLSVNNYANVPDWSLNQWNSQIQTLATGTGLDRYTQIDAWRVYPGAGTQIGYSASLYGGSSAIVQTFTADVTASYVGGNTVLVNHVVVGGVGSSQETITVN